MYFADNNGHYPPQLGCCLGNNTGGLPCSGSGFCTSNNVALAPYFSSLPADNYAVGGVANVGGYVYSQASVDGGGVTAYNLDWFMNGTVGVNCGVGKVVSVNQIPPGSTTGFTVCRYTSQ
jgi:hypothetical protein